MNVIDSHLHLFKANSKDYPRPVHPGLADEDREVLAKELIIKMEKAGVDKAIVVPLGPEDHYLSELQEAYPGKFAAVGIYDADAPDQLKIWTDALKRVASRESEWGSLIRKRV